MSLVPHNRRERTLEIDPDGFRDFVEGLAQQGRRLTPEVVTKQFGYASALLQELPGLAETAANELLGVISVFCEYPDAVNLSALVNNKAITRIEPESFGTFLTVVQNRAQLEKSFDTQLFTFVDRILNMREDLRQIAFDRNYKYEPERSNTNKVMALPFSQD